jgi:hypothetical protein
MKVKAAIEALLGWFDPDDDIAIDWFEKDDFSTVDGESISQEEWEDACYMAEDSEYLMDRDVVEIMIREIKRKQKEEE